MSKTKQTGAALHRAHQTYCWLELTIDARCAERRVGGKTLIPLAGPRLRYRLHETPFQLADAGMVPHNFSLGLIQVLQQGGKSESRLMEGNNYTDRQRLRLGRQEKKANENTGLHFL